MTSALDKLPAKRRAFVLAYAQCLNASQAAAEAGYAKPGQEGHRLLKNAEIQSALNQLTSKPEKHALRTVEGRADWLVRMAEGLEEFEECVGADIEGNPIMVGPKNKDRLKALELLGKMSGDYLTKVETTVSGSLSLSSEERVEAREVLRRHRKQAMKAGGE